MKKKIKNKCLFIDYIYSSFRLNGGFFVYKNVCHLSNTFQNYQIHVKYGKDI